MIIIVKISFTSVSTFAQVRHSHVTLISAHSHGTFPASRDSIGFNLSTPFDPSSARLWTLLKSQLAKWAFFFSHLQNLQQFKLDCMILTALEVSKTF